jgi:NADH-quinone oxidoreductase subunit G
LEKYLKINGKRVLFDNEKNILEIIRKANIELPTFCYHSELSTYGSCRLCMIEIEGKGILPACSTPPESGMRINTNNEQIIEIRKIIVELLLANHDRECTICGKSETCKLQTLARRLGIDEIRFKNVVHKEHKDLSTYSLVREQSKCVLCGDCVRFCDEIQSVGAISFAKRGSESVVCPSFGKDLESSECVYCGQCARVCPTGAIIPKSEVNYVWRVLSDQKKKVIVAVAPAVRAAVGEMFGIRSESGTKTAGKIVTALRSMGFAKVFDISFSADMTIVEEANEFKERLKNNGRLPQFTSCCPAWVKFTEQYYPDFIPNLSTCRSPQAMYGSIAKKIMPGILKVAKEDLVVVSVVPCTAKKFEARRPELSKDGIADIDYVLTTQELARMIEETGLRFNEIEPSSFDMPLGFKTGSGIIFGNSGGVSEAVLRSIADSNCVDVGEVEQFNFVRGGSGINKAKVNIGSRELKIAVVYGLKNARKILRDIKTGNSIYDFIEVMACPGGCIGGAGQPVYTDLEVRKIRTNILYENDKTMELRRSQDNPYIQEIYKNYLGKPGEITACEYLHTEYKHKKRFKETIEIYKSLKENNIEINVCLGNGCMHEGSEEILEHIVSFTESNKYKDNIGIKVSMCLGKCSKGPVVKVADKVLERCTVGMVESVILEELDKIS